MSTFPSVVATFTNPTATNKLNSPSHSSIHSAVNDEVIQLETFVGTLSSAVGTMVYDIRAAASNGGGHVQTANKGGTGQTSFTLGDILVATSASVLTKLAVGTDGYALVADSTQAAGAKWGIPGNVPSLLSVAVASVFTYVKPSVFNYLRVRMVGGGGGFGGGGFGGAGAGAGYSEKIIPASSVASTVVVVVGALGATSSVGGTTAFGSILTAAGGNPGGDDPGSGSTSAGAGGGVGAGGNINLTGANSGQNGRVAGNVPASGGQAPLLSPSGKGADGKTTNVTGAPGLPGQIIIETY